jgi:hypothetical protein
MSYQEHLTAGLAIIRDSTTGGSAERIAPKRKRISQDSLREEIPWTAARCNRLLRTITSRVNILRRQSKLCAAGIPVRVAQPCRDLERSLKEETTPRKDHKTSANDPEWIPGAKLNAPYRTYSNRGRPQQKAVPSLKADSGFSTPFVKRLLKNAPASTAKPWSHNAGAEQQPKRMRQLPVQLASSNEEAQRNLVRAFDSLLMTTSPATRPERTGARSLMSICLSRVPDYIALEAEDVHEDDKDSEDLTSSMYSELESLGTNSDGGWSGLREVVRSHALYHVCAAIQEGLIQNIRIAGIISASREHGALHEEASLLRTWLGKDHGSDSMRVDDMHITLTRLMELRLTYDAPGLYLRHHTDLINSGCLYVSEVLRPGGAPLKDLIRNLVCGPEQDAALAYLEAAVLDDGDSPKSTTLPIFSRLAGLFASLALGQSSSPDTATLELDLFAVVSRIATTILQQEGDSIGTSRCHIQDIERVTKHRTAVHPFIMASTLLQLTSPSANPSIAAARLDSLIAASSAHQSAFVKFAVNVARLIHRFSDADELESLLLTTSGLLSPPPECSSENRSLLNRLAFEIAFAYRDQTGVDIDHHFTAKLAASNTSISQTPRRRVHVSGYKWEEGLCEWVAATPLPKPRPSNTILSWSPPRQLLTPQRNRPDSPPRNSMLVLLSSPDVIASFQSPESSDNTTPNARPVLQERSANQNIRDDLLSPQRKATRPAQPVPKQVHLKEERAKKAALLAQSAALAQPMQANSERSRSVADTSSAQDGRAVNIYTDELGSLTPAHKKLKRVSRLQGASARTSLPARTRTLDVIEDVTSEDELGF